MCMLDCDGCGDNSYGDGFMDANPETRKQRNTANPISLEFRGTTIEMGRWACIIVILSRGTPKNSRVIIQASYKPSMRARRDWPSVLAFPENPVFKKPKRVFKNPLQRVFKDPLSYP